jgi:hypothetical protein
MLSSPRGPTEVIDEEATPFFDPAKGDAQEKVEGVAHIKIQTKDGMGEELEGELEVEGNTATLRLPQKTKQEQKDESEIKVPIDDTPDIETPPMEPPLPPNA